MSNMSELPIYVLHNRRKAAESLLQAAAEFQREAHAVIRDVDAELRRRREAVAAGAEAGAGAVA